MALFEAIVVGGIIGAVVEGCKRELIKQWHHSDELPPMVKLLMIGLLIVIPAVNARTLDTYITTALATIGAFTLARWCVASVLVIWRQLS